jgi:hypothetical protein
LKKSILITVVFIGTAASFLFETTRAREGG